MSAMGEPPRQPESYDCLTSAFAPIDDEIKWEDAGEDDDTEVDATMHFLRREADAQAIGLPPPRSLLEAPREVALKAAADAAGSPHRAARLRAGGFELAAQAVERAAKAREADACVPPDWRRGARDDELSLIHISEPTRPY